MKTVRVIDMQNRLYYDHLNRYHKLIGVVDTDDAYQELAICRGLINEWRSLLDVIRPDDDPFFVPDTRWEPSLETLPGESAAHSTQERDDFIFSVPDYIQFLFVEGWLVRQIKYDRCYKRERLTTREMLADVLCWKTMALDILNNKRKQRITVEADQNGLVRIYNSTNRRPL